MSKPSEVQMKKISVGDIWYDPIQDKIRECVGISQDHLGQPMALFTPVKKKPMKLYECEKI